MSSINSTEVALIQEQHPHPLVERAEELRLEARSIEILGPEIPTDGETLRAILVEAVDGCRARAFVLLSLAALEAGVDVDAGILVSGARLLPHPGFIARLAVRLSGDVAGALVAAVEDGRLSCEKESVALYVAARWSREKGVTAHHEALVRRARMLTRRPIGLEAQTIIVAAATELDDADLDLLVSRFMPSLFPKKVERFAAALMEDAQGPLVSEIDSDEGFVSVATRRRAVPRVGRNEPCPCGSGKKYKRCCFAKDEERNRDASDIAGVTRAEMRRELEDFLTLERLDELRPYELARLDPRRIDESLYLPVLNRLMAFRELDAVVEFFRAVGVAGMEGCFVDAVDLALEDSKLDEARALLEIYDPPEEAWLGFPLRFLKRGVEGGAALEILEEEARAFVDDNSVTLAIDLLRSPWPSLGILVARGVAPFSGPWDRESLFEELGLARDRLGLPASDPSEDMHDLWGWEDDLEDMPAVSAATPLESQRDDSAWRELETKEAELGRLRREMSALREQLESHAHEEAMSAAPVETPAERAEQPEQARDARVTELKERVARLKGELNQRHAERNQLKRQLEREQQRADTLEAERGRSTEVRAEDEGEDEASGSEIDASAPIPVRLPTLTKRFRSSLQHLPDSAKRRTLVLLGRLAAGDQAAFRDTRRLELDRTIWRRRVGRDYRMLFRLGDDKLEVLDIVHRQGLERALRELT